MVVDKALDAPHRRSFTEWCEMVRFSCGQLHVTGTDEHNFHGDMTLARLGHVYTSLISADPHAVRRTRCSERDEEEGFVYLCRLLDGRAELAQDDRVGVARTNEMVAFDNTRPFTLSMTDRFRMLVLKIPHRVIGMAPPATKQLTARRWSSTRGVAALVSPLLIGLAGHMTELDAATAQQVGCSITSLVATLFSEHLRQGPADPAAARQALLLRVQAYARENLNDPRLTPRSIAKHHHISLRQLQKLFQEQGLSPASWIRDERLNRCAADLRDPRLSHAPVALIGERWAFCGPSHFSQLFRERFTVSPQEYRRLDRVPASLAPSANTVDISG